VTSLILRVGTRVLFPLMLVFSVFLLVRGHNEPGGGFVGGLVAAIAFALVLLTDGEATARRTLRVPPVRLIGGGLALAVLAGVPPLVRGEPYLRGLWLKTPLPVIGKLGTPLLFDIGVYFVVFGITIAIVFALAEEAP
jgi:multicomponent Na+:H+ antiporter subunit B